MDRDFRELERRGDDPDAQAAILRHRMRLLEINEFEVKIASFLGHLGAQILYPDALPKGISFKKLNQQDSRLSLLLAWGALKSLLRLWEDDPRTQHLRGQNAAALIPDFKIHFNQRLSVDHLPEIEEVDLHGWPRYILDIVERFFQGSPPHFFNQLAFLRGITFDDIQHNPEGMDRFYYSMRPIEDFIIAIEYLIHADNNPTRSTWLKGIWTTKYHNRPRDGREYPNYLVYHAEAVYRATRVLADSEIIANDIRIPSGISVVQGRLINFNDSGGIRDTFQPKQPKPFVKFKYWQKLHRKAAAPFILQYLL